MFHTTHTLTERVNAVRSAMSAETLTALYTHNAPLTAPATITDAYLNEEVVRVQVREAIATSLICPAGLLKVLAEDPSRCVRRVVAAVACEGSLLNLLATDTDSTVREAVCGNINTAEYLLRVLSMDADPMVRLSAELRLNPQVEMVLEPLCSDRGTASYSDAPSKSLFADLSADLFAEASVSASVKVGGEVREFALTV